ncbi:MAG: hypothetical protein C4575_01995 [Desulforudis sp.]|nr:MAG: hypothetical protein C4575_01995 [Desulforudis sp.]
MQLLKDERGFISAWLLVFAGVLWLVMFAVMLTLGYGVYTKGQATYQWLDASMVYATQDTITQDASGQFKAHENAARRMFIESYESMTNTTFSGTRFQPNAGSIYPGPIELTNFRAVAKGERLPSGARSDDLGFLVQLKVTLWAGRVPFWGQVDIVQVPMTVFSVRQGYDRI